MKKIPFWVKGVGYGLIAPVTLVGLGLLVHGANHKSPGSTVPVPAPQPVAKDPAAARELLMCEREYYNQQPVLDSTDPVTNDVASHVVAQFEYCVRDFGQAQPHIRQNEMVRFLDAAEALVLAEVQVGPDENPDALSQDLAARDQAIPPYQHALKALEEAVR
jgi:hypothetical protein